MAIWSRASVEKRKKARQTAEAKRAAERETKRQKNELQQDAKFYHGRLVKACAQQGMRYIVRAALRPSAFETLALGVDPIVKVRFDRIYANPSQIWYHIDAMRLPYRVSIADFKEPDFLETISIAVGREVRYKSSPSSGAWLVVERDGSISGIPMFVRFQDVFSTIPKTADGLTIAIGRAEHNKTILGSLTNWQHLLVGGATNSGKSVWLNQAILTLAARNTPEQLQLMLVDLKNGVELADYEHLPHLWHPLVKKPDDVLAALEKFITEMNTRGQRFAGAGCRNIKEWNQRHQPDQQLPYIVLIIDELSRLLLNANVEIRKVSKLLLNDVLATARAYGMHAILCTQEPSSKVVPSYLKTNCPGRLCFSMPSIMASITVLGSKSAYRLGTKGRAVFQYGDQEMYIQGPYVGSGAIRSGIKQIIQKRGQPVVERQPEVSMMDVLLYALENLDGNLAYRRLYPHYKDRMGEPKLRRLIDAAEQAGTITIAEVDYEVQRTGFPPGRRLIRVEPGQPSGEQSAELIPVIETGGSR